MVRRSGCLFKNFQVTEIVVLFFFFWSFIEYINTATGNFPLLEIIHSMFISHNKPDSENTDTDVCRKKSIKSIKYSIDTIAASYVCMN